MKEKEFKLNGEELRKALAEIEKAEKSGFMFCEAVFDVREAENDHWLTGNYLELLEKAHPTEESLNWGRGQDVTKRNIFKDGRVVPTKETKEINDNYPASKAIENGEIDSLKYWIVPSRYPEYAGLNGYVAFPKKPVIENGYSGLLTYVPVHGGITYASQGKLGMVYGFDTAHSDSEKFPRNDKEWIKKQCKKMIDGILMAKKVEKKYLTAKNQKTKAKYAQMVLDTDKDKENQHNFGIGINVLSGEV